MQNSSSESFSWSEPESKDLQMKSAMKLPRTSTSTLTRGRWKEVNKKKLVNNFNGKCTENVLSKMKTWWRETGGGRGSPNPCDTWRDLGRRRRSKTSCRKHCNRASSMVWKWPQLYYVDFITWMIHDGTWSRVRCGTWISGFPGTDYHGKAGGTKSWQS